MDIYFLHLRRAVIIFLCALLCAVISACGQSATVSAPVVTTPTLSVSPSPTVDPLTLNICATCDVQQRRVQATAAATK